MLAERGAASLVIDAPWAQAEAWVKTGRQHVAWPTGATLILYWWRPDEFEAVLRGDGRPPVQIARRG
jgi:hypothetical protein